MYSQQLCRLPPKPAPRWIELSLYPTKPGTPPRVLSDDVFIVLAVSNRWPRVVRDLTNRADDLVDPPVVLDDFAVTDALASKHSRRRRVEHQRATGSNVLHQRVFEC